MKTNLEITINTVQEAKSFLEELHRNGELMSLTVERDHVSSHRESCLLSLHINEMDDLAPEFCYKDYAIDLLTPPIEAPEVFYENIDQDEDPDIIADILHDFCSEELERTVEVDPWSKSEILEEWQEEKLREILKDIEEEDEIFYLDGESFKGNIPAMARVYVIENPSRSFRTWLIDGGLRIDETLQESQKQITKRVYLKVKTPGSFSDLYHKNPRGRIETLEDAQEAISTFGTTDPASEYYESGVMMRSKCSIVRVTEIEEVIQEAENQEHE